MARRRRYRKTGSWWATPDDLVDEVLGLWDRYWKANQMSREDTEQAVTARIVIEILQKLVAGEP